MEHDPTNFEKNEDNPIGVGPDFGQTVDDGLDADNQLDVLWTDKKKEKISQILSWRCPPVNKKKLFV